MNNKKIILLYNYSIWNSGNTFHEEFNMWKEFNGAIHGISKPTMEYLIKNGIAKII